MKSSGTPGRASAGTWATAAVLLVGYLVALALLAVSAAVDLRITRELEESGKAVSRTIEAMEKLRQVGNTFFLAESAHRGYLLTGQDSYLDPYREMHQAIGSRLDETNRLVSDTPAQRDRLNTLRSLADRRFSQMDGTLDAYRTGGQQSSIAVINSNGGRETMVEARSLILAMLTEEAMLRDRQRVKESRAATGGRRETLLASAFVGLALSAFFFLMYRYLRQRDAALRAIESSKDELERRVAERTAELSNLSRHLLEIREDEKRSIARDLHDELGSFLTAINMDVSRMRDRMLATDPEQAAKFDRTLSLLNQAITMKRRLVGNLRPSVLDNLGLGAALEQHIDAWSRRTGIVAAFDFKGELYTEAEGCPIAIFRVFQEALDNIALHSRATAVACHVRRVGDSIDLEIADNGIGLSDSARSKPDTHGLLGIRERVLAYHGRLEFSRGAEGGTVIRASFPCRLPARDEIAKAVATALA